MTIDSYLTEVRRLLPYTARLRALAEVREHLRDAAARHRAEGASPGDAEMLATAEFGEAAEVASRLGRELAIRETRVAALLAVGAVALFVFPFYVVPENTMPPAPWAEKPSELLALQRLTLALWLAAGALAMAGVVLAWSRWARAASVAMVATATAITGASVVSVILFWRWTAYTPSTPNLALANALALSIVVICSAATWRTLSSRRRLALH